MELERKFCNIESEETLGIANFITKKQVSNKFKFSP